MDDALKLTRRGLGGLAAATALAGPVRAQGRGTPVRVGLMLPYSGTFAQLGVSITAAFEMHLAERGGQLGGRPVTIVRLDDASDPAAGDPSRRCGRQAEGTAAFGPRASSASICVSSLPKSTGLG